MIGRVDIVATLAARLPRQRFITIVGPGGIGKTSVALAVADETSSASVRNLAASRRAAKSGAWSRATVEGR